MNRNRYSKPAKIILYVVFLTLAGCSHTNSLAVNTADEDIHNTADTDVILQIQPPDPVMVYYEGQVRHIFFHPLVAWPEIAFTGSMKEHMMEWFVTADEYKKILFELYMADYVLVHIDELYDVTYSDGVRTVTGKKALVPEGKKPIVLSIDDLSYHKYMKENGVVHRLVFDENGEIAAWTDNGNGGEISYDLDVVTVLEDFIRKYPDFSIRGARGIIALTGYEGVLGYNTHELDAPGYQEEVEKAIAVVNKLKELGWRFASHSWGHPNLPTVSMTRFMSDTNRWDIEVRPIVGDTNLFIYPFGARLETQENRHSVLRERDFYIFFGVGGGYGYSQFPGFININRRNIDGFYFREYRNRQYPEKLFDFEKVIDKESRGIR